MSRQKGRRLSDAQKREIEKDGVSWVGWDLNNRPVISRRIWGEEIEFALKRNGDYMKTVALPIERAE
jgi:hypothetical protein